MWNEDDDFRYRDKEWEDFLRGYSPYGDESPRFGRVDEGLNSKVTRVSPTEALVEGGCKVVGPAHLIDFYFGKGGKQKE